MKNQTPGTKPDDSCLLTFSGGTEKTFFGFMNAVPQKPEMDLLGHVEGISETSVTGCVTIQLKRKDQPLNSREYCFNSDPVRSYDSPELPHWARVLVREAAYSSAPIFSLK